MQSCASAVACESNVLMKRQCSIVLDYQSELRVQVGKTRAIAELRIRAEEISQA
jgi:hypothetical protein